MSIVLVTGSNSGLGRATALAFATTGARVIAGMRDPVRGAELAREAQARELDVVVATLDVTDDDSVETAVETILARDGRIDVLVNNAGVLHTGSVELLPEELVHAMFETNVFGAVRMIRAVLPSMRARGSGAIVNVSSLAGRVPTLPANAFYAATKHALSALSDGLALEVEPFGIRVACIEPGFFCSEITRAAARPADGSSPYGALEDAVWRRLTSGVTDGLDPRIVATMIVSAAAAPAGDAVHVLVGDDAEQYVEAYRTLGELEYTALVREYIGMAGASTPGARR